VIYEFSRIKVPTLLIIGQDDRTVLGKNRLPAAQQNKYGQFSILGRRTRDAIPNAKLFELPNIGHIPHVQALGPFMSAVLNFFRPTQM
jgi:pimeloyl-ACP methyl ester carboxylesterase